MMRATEKRSPGAVLGRSGSTGDLTDMEVSAVTDSTHKKCAKCGRVFPLARFSRMTREPDGLCRECKECRAERARRYFLMQRFGLTPEDYDTMLRDQGGVCAVCGGDKPGGRWDRFHVDHCHQTGAVRGLLCYPCNYSIGVLGDTVEALTGVVAYLKGESGRV